MSASLSHFSVAVLLLSSALTHPAAQARQPYEFTQIHMGMPVRILLYAEDESRARDAALAAFNRIAALDAMMTDYRPDSELRGLERRPLEWVPVSPELFFVLHRGVEVARRTDGAFDPTVGPFVTLWRDARKNGRLPGRSALKTARQRVGWRHIETDARRGTIRLAKRGIRLDLGGIAKGYILQNALRTLNAHGVTRALLEAGGDIAVGDAPPGKPGWRIETGVADAAFRERATSLTHAALATSGASAQNVEIDGLRYSHVVDPRTGLGVTSQWTARVIAGDATTADALATALTVLGPERVPDLCARFPEVMISVERDPRQSGAGSSLGTSACTIASATK